MHTKTNTRTKRGKMIAFAKNTIATVSNGITKSAYYNMLANALEIGFRNITFQPTSDNQEAEKIYDEAFKSYWILIAFSHKNNFALNVDSEQTFASLLADSTKDDLTFYVWYPSDAEVKTLAANALPLDEIEIEKKAMQNAPGCS